MGISAQISSVSSIYDQHSPKQVSRVLSASRLQNETIWIHSETLPCHKSKSSAHWFRHLSIVSLSWFIMSSQRSPHLLLHSLDAEQLQICVSERPLLAFTSLTMHVNTMFVQWIPRSLTMKHNICSLVYRILQISNISITKGMFWSQVSQCLDTVGCVTEMAVVG